MLVPATTVPVTIIGAFIAMAGLGFTVNLMTLYALILAIGIVVDDAIIIVENSSYYIEQGMPPKEATIDRKSTRLNSSHLVISYAVFCLKKKKIIYPRRHGDQKVHAMTPADSSR